MLRLPTLQSLELGDVPIMQLPPFRQLQGLTRLVLKYLALLRKSKNKKIENFEPSMLHGLTALQRLRLQALRVRQPLPNATLKGICELKSLRWLTMWDMDWRNNAVALGHQLLGRMPASNPGIMIQL